MDDSEPVQKSADELISDLKDAVARLTDAVRRRDPEISVPQKSELAKVDRDQLEKFIKENPEIYAQWISKWDNEKKEILSHWSELMIGYRESEDSSQNDIYGFFLSNVDQITLERASYFIKNLVPAKKKSGKKKGQRQYIDEDNWSISEILSRFQNGEDITAAVRDVAKRAAGQNTTLQSRERRLWRRLGEIGWSR
jgi:hypothetical protein